jgi:hypothetical protein
MHRGVRLQPLPIINIQSPSVIIFLLMRAKPPAHNEIFDKWWMRRG